MVSTEATARDSQQGSAGRSDKDEVNTLLTSAEQCLAAMRTRIKIIHGVSRMLTGNFTNQLLITLSPAI